MEMHELSKNIELNVLTSICANKDLPENIRNATADSIIEYTEKNI